MKKSLIVLFTVLVIFGKAQLAHNYAYGFGGTGVDNARAIVLDSQGNVYVGGYFSGTVDFYPGTPTQTIQSQGAEDAFISVYDMFGNFSNAISFSNNLNCKIFGMATDSQDNLYVTGAFTGSVDFDPGIGVTQLVAGGYYDIFIVKLAPNQVLQWAQRIGHTAYDDHAYSITCDKNDNVLVTGFFQGTNVDFDGASATQYTLSSQSGKDVFVLKLNSNGAFQWAIDLGAPGSFISDEGKVVKTDTNNNVLVGGYFGGTIDFDPGVGTQTIIPSGNIDAFVAKYSPSGSLMWAKNFSGPGNEITYGLTVDNNNDVYCTGYFTGTVDFDANTVATASQIAIGMEDVFITKYSSAGNFAWVRNFGGVGMDQGSALAIDNQTLTVSGFYQSVVDFNPSVLTNTFVSQGGSTDGFVSEFDLNGNYINTYAFGGLANDYLYSVSTNTLGEVFACGSYSLSIDFDSGPAVNTYLSNGNEDAYLLKLNHSSVGIDEFQNSDIELSIYPNPSSEKINFEPIRNEMKIEIVNSRGELVKGKLVNQDDVEIDISELPQGIYFINLITSQKVYHTKLIKQ